MGEKKLKTAKIDTKKQKGKKEVKPAVKKIKQTPPKKEKKVIKDVPTKNLVADALEKPKNGIPINPKCSWSYEQLCDFYHNCLEVSLKELQANHQLAIDSIVDFDDGSNGFDDNVGGPILSTQRTNVSLAAVSSQTINRLELAKKRILSGEFSNQCSCGEEIIEARLKILPGTKICAKCAKKLK